MEKWVGVIIMVLCGDKIYEGFGNDGLLKVMENTKKEENRTE